MFDLEKLIRDNIRSLSPYTSARDEFSGQAKIYLDANENSYGSIGTENHNRYPDPRHLALRQRLSEVKGIAPENIFVGNGSDEAIDLLVRIFCRPGADSILTLYPSYGMYQVVAATNDVAVKTVSLKSDYSLDADALISAIESTTKIIFVCNPNNPTGNAFSKEDLLRICKASEERNTVLIIDEAYIDFAPGYSLQDEVSGRSNLVVLQTLSKAWGLAEIRLGMALASEDIISYLYRIKPPYNVNGLSQQVATQALSAVSEMKKLTAQIIAERERLSAALSKLPCVERVYPSETNFLFVKFKEAGKLYRQLLSEGIVVRDRSNVPQCEGCFRITLGTEAENDALLAALSGEKPQINFNSSQNAVYTSAKLPPRIAEIKRSTSETKISVRINLDGSGQYKISTGLGFFDHMLCQIARHGAVDLELSCQGDLEVDEHHTIEDTAIALGEALRKALGDKRGIERYGFLLPMDDALAQVALDFSGRSWLEWDASFKREKVGDMPTEMFRHFFKSLSDSAACNLNIKAGGDNEHHKIEAIFKGFARALRQAVSRSANSDQIPSTKGSL